MLAAQTIFSNSMDDAPELEIEATEEPPERRLWIAVILAAINEYQIWLRRIETTWLMHRRPLNSSYRAELDSIRHEIESKWFGHICDNAEIAQSWIVAKLDMLDREFCLSSVRFDNQAPQRLSPYHVRRARLRQRLRRE